MRRPIPYVIAAVMLVVSGCAGLRISGLFRPSPGDWVAQGGSNFRTNAVSVEVRPPLKMVWTYNAQAGILATPLVRDSVVIVATLGGELQAVNMANGVRIGYETFPAPLRATPAIDGVNVIVCLTGAKYSVARFDLREGRKTWTADLGPIEASPMFVGEQIIVATLAGKVTALDRSSGEEVWTYAPGNARHRARMRVAPVRARHIIAVADEDGVVHAIDSAQGTPVWRQKMDRSVFASLTSLDTLLIAADIGGTVRAMSANDGSIRWTRRFGSPVYGGPSTDGRMVYVAFADGRVTALDAAHGATQWTYTGRAVINTSPLVLGEHLVVGALDRELVMLSTRDGSVSWRMTLDGRIKVSPVMWKGTILVVAEDKSVIAFRGEDRP